MTSLRTLAVLIGFLYSEDASFFLETIDTSTTILTTAAMDGRRRYSAGSSERIIRAAEADYGSGNRRGGAYQTRRDSVLPQRPYANHRDRVSTAGLVSSVLSPRLRASSAVTKRNDRYSELRSRRAEERAQFDDSYRSRPRRSHHTTPPLPKISALNRQLKEQNILSQCGQGPERRGTAVASLRPTDRIHNRDAYSLGCIFSAPDHAAANHDMEVDALDPARVATPFGVILSKYRKRVVIATYGHAVATVPIYTHNGNGLEYKRFKNEYVSVRDLKTEYPCPPETEHGCLYAWRLEEFPGTFLSGRASIHLIDQRLHSYNQYATIEGHLDDVSLTKLQGLLARTAYERFTAFQETIPSASSLIATAEDKEEGEISEDELDEMGRNLSLASEYIRRHRLSSNGRTKKHTTGFTWSSNGLRKVLHQ